MIIMGIAAIAFLCSLILLNALPTDLTIILTVIMLAMIAASSLLLTRSGKWKRAAGVILSALFIILFGSMAYFFGTAYATMSRISTPGSVDMTSGGRHIDPTTEPFNVYITGIDQFESEKGLDLERSDVNMIVSVHPVTKRIVLTSIPRDTYVKLHTAQQMDKLTHTGVYGVDETLNTVQDWLGIELDYYAKMNFSAARDIIDAIGGIDVYNEVAFESSLKGYKYEKGWDHMDGQLSLYYARERKAFEGLDSVRVENQQKVAEAVIKKLTSSPSLLTNYGEIMDAAGSNLSTDMPADVITALVRMQIADLGSWDIKSQKIEGEYDMDYVASLSSRNMYSVYRPKESSVDKCVNGIKQVLEPTDEEIRRARESRSRSFFVSLIKRMTNKVSGAGEEEE